MDRPPRGQQPVHWLLLEAMPGVEPGDQGFAGPCLAVWLHRRGALSDTVPQHALSVSAASVVSGIVWPSRGRSTRRQEHLDPGRSWRRVGAEPAADAASLGRSACAQARRSNCSSPCKTLTALTTRVLRLPRRVTWGSAVVGRNRGLCRTGCMQRPPITRGLACDSLWRRSRRCASPP
jgi:hypothetical protein